MTVDDVWRVPSTVLARAGRAAAEAQEALTAILERVEVTVVRGEDGRLTFFPHDHADVEAIRAAQSAARMVLAHLTAAAR
ncbi:hypothetical protein ACQP1P_40375 [Dactylosporangium sp. CA-052675]|uniref:hypothetical protein n=1 Tax=Dactylosporangium sp. CA-052675 TaxID=3239927 RepID=UPI003D924649